MNKSNVRATVDRLGVIRAQISQLEETEKAVKASLAEMGVGEYEGDNYVASVLQSERHNLDMAAVREKLSPQFIAAHTTISKITTVKCKARPPVVPVGIVGEPIRVSK